MADILSELGFRYTGCTSPALALGLDKAKSKDLMRAHGIQTPDYQQLTPETVGSFRLRFPCIVKPSGQDASHGLSANSVVSDQACLERQVAVVSRSFGGERAGGGVRGRAGVQRHRDGQQADERSCPYRR